MKNSIGSVFFAFALLTILLSGCKPGQFLGPTLTPTSTPTITPTFTPSSTSTPEPTYTPTLTSTPEATYTPIAADILLVTRVIRREDFNDKSSFEFKLNGNYNLSNGLLILDDPIVSGDIWADGSARIFSTFQVKQGNGYLLLFRTKPDTTFLITFEFGPFDDPSYRAFWLVNGRDINIWSGSIQLVSQSLRFQYQPETWYYLLIWLNADGIEGKIWEKDYPETNKVFSVDTGKEWVSNQLLYTVNVPEGTVEIDEFQELEFSE